jgi:hypothetical protein
MTAYFLDQLPLPFNLDKNKNSAREMTPDSIDNNEFTKSRRSKTIVCVMRVMSKEVEVTNNH